MDMLSVKEQHACTLLIYHRWDVEKLFAVYVDRGKAFLFGEAGVSVDEHRDSDLLVSSSVMCDICMDDVPSDEATRMDCGHCFCNSCWIQHFIVKINEGQSKRIRCMAHKCNSICDEAVVRTLLSRKHPDMAEKYERFLLESYIEDNKRVKWCPSTPHCGKAIRVEDDDLCEGKVFLSLILGLSKELLKEKRFCALVLYVAMTVGNYPKSFGVLRRYIVGSIGA